MQDNADAKKTDTEEDDRNLADLLVDQIEFSGAFTTVAPAGQISSASPAPSRCCLLLCPASACNHEQPLACCSDAHVASFGVLAADVIILNKVDLVSPEELKSLETFTKTMNPCAKLICAKEAKVPPPSPFPRQCIAPFNYTRASPFDSNVRGWPGTMWAFGWERRGKDASLSALHSQL